METKEPDPTCLPGQELTAGRGPDRHEAARLTETGRIDIKPPASPFRLANTLVFVADSPAGYVARIERGSTTDYGLLAPGTVDALAEVARA